MLVNGVKLLDYIESVPTPAYYNPSPVATPTGFFLSSSDKALPYLNRSKMGAFVLEEQDVDVGKEGRTTGKMWN